MQKVYPLYHVVGDKRKPCTLPKCLFYNNDGRCGDAFCVTTVKPRWVEDEERWNGAAEDAFLVAGDR